MLHDVEGVLAVSASAPSNVDGHVLCVRPTDGDVDLLMRGRRGPCALWISD